MPRKIANIHCTYKGHYNIMPKFEYTTLFHCHEIGEGGQEHTHMGIVAKEKQTKEWFVKELQKEILPNHACNIRIDVHPRWETMLGYHCGLGDKPACGDSLTVIKPEGFDVSKYIRARVMHKCTGINGHKTRNDVIMTKSVPDLVADGDINIEKAINIQRNKEEIEQQIHYAKKVELTDGQPIANSLGRQLAFEPIAKLRHFFLRGSPNTGKSTTLNLMESLYRTGRPGEKGWWHVAPGMQLLLLDGVKPGMFDWHTIERICDGTYYFNRKGRSEVRPTNPFVVVIGSNHSHTDLWPEDDQYFQVRFQVIDL